MFALCRTVYWPDGLLFCPLLIVFVCFLFLSAPLSVTQTLPSDHSLSGLFSSTPSVAETHLALIIHPQNTTFCQSMRVCLVPFPLSRPCVMLVGCNYCAGKWHWHVKSHNVFCYYRNLGSLRYGNEYCVEDAVWGKTVFVLFNWSLFLITQWNWTFIGFRASVIKTD